MLGYTRFDLYVAIKENDFNRAKTCLDTLTKNNVLDVFDSDDDNRKIPILFVLAKFGRCGAWLDLFLEYIPINQEDKDENVALHVAAKYAQLEFYKALITQGLSIKLNKFGHSPVYAAAEQPYMFQELLIYHQDQLITENILNSNTRTTTLPISHYLIQTENIESFQILLDHYNWSCEQFMGLNDFNGLNPLEFAAKTERNCFIDLIFEHYRSAESHYNLLYNSHVLHVAASTNNHTIVRRLLELKADPELVDKSNKIPKAYTTNPSICYLLDNEKLKRPTVSNEKQS